LPLCVLAAGAVHGLAVMALLPMMITLPGPGAVQQESSHAVDVNVMPASAATLPSLAPRDPETTASLPEAAEHPGPAPASDREAGDAGGDDDTVPAEPGVAAVPEPRIEPVATIVTPVAVRIPELAPEAVEEPPADADNSLPAAEDASPPPPEVETDDEAAAEGIAAPVVRAEPARPETPAAETTPAAATEPAEPELETNAVEEDVPPPEAAKEVEPRPEANVEKTPPPIPTLKPAKSAAPKARASAPQKKASPTPPKRGGSHARRSVRTRTVTKTQGGLFQDLFGPPQSAASATSRRSTTKRQTTQSER
jgi:hypothetical protein